MCQTTSASAAHTLRSVLITVPCVGCSYELFPDRSTKVLIDGNEEWDNFRLLNDPRVAMSTFDAQDYVAGEEFKKNQWEGVAKEDQVRPQTLNPEP